METLQTISSGAPHLENQSPVISFRPFRPSNSTDFNAIMDFGSDPRVNRTFHFHLFADGEDAARFIETVIIPLRWFRFICLSDGDRPIGFVTFRSEDAGGGRQRIVIGYSVVPEFWGRGIATKAVMKAMAEAFEMWPEIKRFQALVFLDNPASQRVLEKAGFQKEAVLRKYMLSKGEARDVALYSFIVAD